jgi:hypothetical protein
MRLFICLSDKSIEALPDYAGPMVWDQDFKVEVPAHDDLLEHVIAPHQQRGCIGHLATVEDADWENPTKRAEIVKQIWTNAGHTGFDPAVYAVRDTLSEDALKCYNAHRRPTDNCIDYRTRSKRLGNDLLDHDEKKLAKREGLKRREIRFLCEWCPYESVVNQKKDNAGVPR